MLRGTDYEGIKEESIQNVVQKVEQIWIRNKLN